MPLVLYIILSAVFTGLSRLPLYTGWMGFISLIPLLFYFEKGKKRWRILFRDAFIYSAVSFTIWMHWIWGVTAGGFVGIIILYSIYFFITFWLIQLIWCKLPRLRYAGFIIIWLCLGYLQNYGQFRFPWTDLGYCVADYTVLIQAADIGGVSLLSLLILLINVSLYQVYWQRYKLLYVCIGLFILWLGYGMYELHTLKLEKKPDRIAIMQPSIPQDEKWETDHFEELYRRYVQLTLQAVKEKMQLVIWPEAAMPAYVLRDPSFKDLVQNLCDAYRIEIFTGFPDVLPAPPHYPGENYYYNAATLFHPLLPNDPPYYKIALVPVGERMPLLEILPFMWKVQFGQANWEYGKKVAFFTSGKSVFSPQICFEIAFGELNRRMAFSNLSQGDFAHPHKIDYLVNLTNDAWFGKSSGPWIHGMLTKFRAVENRIAIYRCANTGISMVVDPLGRVQEKSRLYDIALVKAPLYTCAKVPLYYYLYAWMRLVCLAALILLIWAFIRKSPDDSVC